MGAMTAILTEIRRLEELRDRGDITGAEFAARRNDVLDAVEVAETHFDMTPASETPTRRASGNVFGLGLVMGLGVMGACVGLTLLLLPDLNLALTLGVTVLAALTVALFRALDD